MEQENNMSESQRPSGLFVIKVSEETKSVGLYLEKGSCEQLGLDYEHCGEKLYYEWERLVEPEDRELIRRGIRTAVEGMNAEAVYTWNHFMYGRIRMKVVSVQSELVDGCYVIRGYYRTIDDRRERGNDTNIALMRMLLSDTMMDSYVLCALADIESNQIYLIRDVFSVSGVLGNEFTYDMWRETFEGLVQREDVESFNEATDRKSLAVFFRDNSDEVTLEFRCLNPTTRRVRWLKLQFVKMKNRLTDRYHEFFVMRDITESHHADYRTRLEMQIIKGLAVPYIIIDLVNLRTGRYFSKNSVENLQPEEEGWFDDALTKFLYKCDCSESERLSFISRFMYRSLAEAFRSGTKIVEDELLYSSQNDNYEWVRVQAYPTSFEGDEPTSAMLTIQSIDEEKNKELQHKQALEYALRSEQQYKKAILSNAFAVYTFNVTKDIVVDEVIDSEYYTALLPRLGMSIPCNFSEYIRRKGAICSIKEEGERFAKLFARETLLDMFDSKLATFDFEYEFPSPDGTRNGVFREAVILTKDLQTDDVWGISYVRNITSERDESKRIEQALRDAFAQAQHASEAKTVFMSQMSHDIRTPLNSILGMAAIAQEYADDPVRVADSMQKIETAGRHLLELINNILDLSAIESGKTVLASEAFDLGSCVDETLKMIGSLTQGKHHDLRVDIRLKNTSVMGDKGKLRQVLMNVLGNSVKYTPDGGVISFTAEETGEERGDFCEYRFIVVDNGIGMSQEFLKRIFDPFVRADDRRTSRIEGTGLGLAIAHNMAKLMGGDISVESEEGKGSRFVVTVCLKRAAEVIKQEKLNAPKKRVRMSDYDFGGRRVLLAEDLEFNAEIATEFLHQANITAEVARDGAEAVRMFEQSEPGYYELIFMDIIMPELDGCEAARTIRSMERGDAKTIPIIAMTANAFVEDIKKTMKAGMNGHIAKPIEIPQLAAELTKWFGSGEKGNK
ncbi:MAG: hybrid sensor histidine kinase/response regulator [Oscillospiraceae bacterium]